MKTSIPLYVVMILITTGQFALASGFRCEGEDSGFRAKLFNHVHPTLGTRVPAALVVSHEDEGTLLSVRGSSKIFKRNLPGSVEYIVEGNERLNAETVILKIQFKEGLEVIAKGERVLGQLILMNPDSQDIYELSCERYLKTVK